MARDGDTILVGPGVYPGPISFGGKSIRIEGTAGPHSTVIDNQGWPVSIVWFEEEEGPAAVLAGFTLTGGEPHGSGVIHVGPNAAPTIENVVVANNTISDGGGGIYCDSATPLIHNCLIASNIVSGNGGGIYCFNSTPIVTNCTVADNTSDANGGGIYLDVSSPTLTDCILWGNMPNAVHVASGSPVITYCDVQESWPGAGNLNVNPLFVPGPVGSYYSSQTAAGQTQQSLCVDAGSDAAVNLLTNDALDPESKIPELKVCKVKISVPEEQ